MKRAKSPPGIIACSAQRNFSPSSSAGAPHWIRVNTISPGPIVTPVTKTFMDANPDFKACFSGWPLLGRTGLAIDVAFAALYLASEESSFVTGANFVIDGGWAAKGGHTPH
jgi:meso-butanediol dehydrogenase / (S,S)-butanediol dehydrogenase / diacetyl reductase